MEKIIEDIQQQLDELKKLAKPKIMYPIVIENFNFDNLGQYNLEDNVKDCIVRINKNYYFYQSNIRCEILDNIPNIIFADGFGEYHFREEYKFRIITQIGTDHYYNKSGQLHRENYLPAVIFKDGTKKYYLNGVEYIPEKIKRINELESELTKLKAEQD